MERNEIRSDRFSARTVTGTLLAEGFVDGPAEEIDAGASYTFEACIDGRWYRWTGQRPTIVGDRFKFWLRDGTPIEAPDDMAEGTGPRFGGS